MLWAETTPDQISFMAVWESGNLVISSPSALRIVLKMRRCAWT